MRLQEGKAYSITFSSGGTTFVFIHKSTGQYVYTVLTMELSATECRRLTKCPLCGIHRLSDGTKFNEL